MALDVIQTGHMTGLKLDCDSFRSDSNRSYNGFETKTVMALDMIQTGHMTGLKLRL